MTKFKIKNNFNILSIFLGLFFHTFIVNNQCFAAADLKLVSDGFLRNSEVRSNSAYSIIVGPRLESYGKSIDSKLDLSAYAYLNSVSNTTAESTNAYIATSKNIITHHQFTFGRRVYDWSVLDDQWTYGLWSPRFIWDPYKPQKVGLTGFFHQYQSASWRFTAYGSPVSVPERSYPQTISDGKVSSPSPYFIPQYESAQVINSNISMKYNVNAPTISKILFRPAAGLQAKYGKSEGPWVSAGYGYMPIHQIDLAVHPAVYLNTNTLNVDIYPRFPMHHLFTTETGYFQKEWGLWASGSMDQPEAVEKDPAWISNRLNPAVLGGGGAYIHALDSLTLKSSYLFVVEQNQGVEAPSAASNVNINLPTRFMYRRALQAGGDWDAGTKITTSMKWTYDLINQASLFSAQINYKPTTIGYRMLKNESWQLTLGADMIASNTNQGWIGQYNGDDRVRMGVGYAF